MKRTKSFYDLREALPEPGTLILLALGGAGVLVHRRWRR